MSDWGPFALNGKVAVVTGGAAGIGLGIVQGLCAAGATVVAVGRRADGADIVACVGDAASYLQADLADPATPDHIIGEVLRRHDRVDILVNNAAMRGNIPLTDLTADAIDAMAAVNLRAVLLMARAFAIARRQFGPGGKIVNVGSLEGHISTLPSGMAAYSATKTAVAGITVTLAHELGPAGIGVNAVSPGAVIHDNLFATGDRKISGDALQAGLDALKARTNTQRLGTPQDIANICVFLASSASDYLSGQVLYADGGTSVC